VPFNWATQLIRFEERCETASPQEEDLLVEELFALLERGPPDLCRPLIGTLDLERIRSLIGANCAEGAALAIVQNSGYMISGAPGGMTIVTIMAPYGNSEHSASAPSLARAICTAISGALCATLIATERRVGTAARGHLRNI
jgi:hypothetical protein